MGPEVTDEDLQELFEEHGGPIKKADIFYKQANAHDTSSLRPHALVAQGLMH